MLFRNIPCNALARHAFKNVFLNAFMSSEFFTFIRSWYLSRFALNWSDGGVSV